MSIAGYLAPVNGRLRGLNIPGGLAGNGIVVRGAVLEGRSTVDQAMVLNWIRGCQQQAEPSVTGAGKARVPGLVAETDPGEAPRD